MIYANHAGNFVSQITHGRFRLEAHIHELIKQKQRLLMIEQAIMHQVEPSSSQLVSRLGT